MQKNQPQNMPLRQVDYFELKSGNAFNVPFKLPERAEKGSVPGRGLPLETAFSPERQLHGRANSVHQTPVHLVFP